jgi:SAM-dependent methyltransferase
MIYRDYFKTYLNQIIKFDMVKKVINYYPFPIIDDLVKDVCQFLGLEKKKYLNHLYKKDYKTFLAPTSKESEIYEEWLKGSTYYFYDLCQWHQNKKLYFLIKNLFQPSNLHILDFGSGIGTHSLIYAKKNFITLVEINEMLLDFTKWRFKKFKLINKANFYKKIPKNQRFDMILLMDVIGHLTNPESIISYICSALKEGGILRVTFDNVIDENDDIFHRNKNINFNNLFINNNLKRINKHHYIRIK